MASAENGVPRWSSGYLWGVLSIVLVSAIWAAASVLVQFIYEEEAFDAPFVLTYTCTSLFTVYLPVWHGLRRLALNKPAAASVFATLTQETHHRGELRRRAAAEAEAGREGAEAETDALVQAEVLAVAPAAGAADDVLSCVVSQRAHVLLALSICPLWFLANGAYNVSLDLTSVTNSTILSTTSSIFTYLFGVASGEERVHWLSVAGIACTFAGVVLTTLSDATAGDGGGRSLWGDLVCLFGALMYAAYTTALKRFSPPDEDVSTSLMLGYMGAINGAVLLPVVGLVALYGVEPVTSLTLQILGLLVLKGLLDNVLSDYLWMRAVLLTSPTVATVGLSLTVPMAFVTDFLFKGGVLPRTGAVCGGLLVILGFAIVTRAAQVQGYATQKGQGGPVLPATLRQALAWFGGACASAG